METLNDVFEHTLQDIYYAEQALTKAIPKAQRAACHPELKDALAAHLGETKEHVKTLQQVFKTLGQEASGEKCPGHRRPDRRDRGRDRGRLGRRARRRAHRLLPGIEHYEISRYGSLREWAKVLGNTEAHDLLSNILDQEKAANNKLTHLAVSTVNQTAEA